MKKYLFIVFLFIPFSVYSSGCYDLLGNISVGPFAYYNQDLRQFSYGLNGNFAFIFLNCGYDLKKTTNSYDTEYFGGVGFLFIAQLQYGSKGNLRFKSEYPITDPTGCNSEGLKFLRNGLQVNAYIQKNVKIANNWEYGLGVGITI